MKMRIVERYIDPGNGDDGIGVMMPLSGRIKGIYTSPNLPLGPTNPITLIIEAVALEKIDDEDSVFFSVYKEGDVFNSDHRKYIGSVFDIHSTKLWHVYQWI